MPTHVFIDAEECDIYDNSVVLCEHIITIDKTHLHYKLFDLPSTYHRRINNALSISLGLE